jgi:hypothetical protein
MSVAPTPSSDETSKDRGYIQTYTGVQFHLEDPLFRMTDIAHALSMQCRFAGHVKRFYSVAEHSVIVSLLMQELSLGDPMEGLLHDAAEAYLVDMPRPWKNMLPDYSRLEAALEAKFRAQFHLPAEKSHGCKTADHLALFIEGYYLVADQGRCYGDPFSVRPIAMDLVKAGWRVVNLLPADAEEKFMQRYNTLGSENHGR